MKYDVVIAGGGVIGGMIARELSRYKLNCCILEKGNDVAVGASRANSGIVHGGYDPEPGTLKAKLNVKGAKMLFETAKELNVPCIQNGSMICAFSEDESDTLRELYNRGKINGVENMEILAGPEARALEPELSEEVTAALLVPSAGIICPYELTIAAVGNAMDNGVELKCNFKITDIKKNGDFFTVTSEKGESVNCDYLINCAGCGSGKIAALAGDNSIKIIPRAGEYMLIDKAEGWRVYRTIFQVPTSEGKGILVTPTVGGNLLTGPTAAVVESCESRDTTQKGLDSVLKLALKSVPDIDFRQTITSFTGIRSSHDSGDFIIEESSNVKNLINVAAIDSPGLSCCVAIAEYTIDILKNCGIELIANPDFNGRRSDPHAFKKMNDEEKDLYIKEHPAYGRIICRCETVSEGEIIDAIKRNPPARDLDGVKRRTRSGMGRCQGGFCSPYIMKLISDEQNIPMEEITKCGGNSKMVVGKL